MELADYLAILKRRWLSILMATLLGLAAGLAFSLLQTPMYTASSQVFVSVRGAGDNVNELVQGTTFTTRAVRTYTQLVSAPRVLEPVIAELGLNTTPVQLAERVRAQSPLDTVLINVTADDPSPIMAAEIANATARSLANVVTELETPAGAVDSPVQISTVRDALVPLSPSSPNLPLNAALGLLVGLAIGLGLAILREVLNTKVRGVSDVENLTDAPILGAIAYEPDAVGRPIIIHQSPHAPRSEAYRRLRTNVQFLDVEGTNNAILITSSLPGEGKTSTTINLAITMAAAGQKVVVVDADLRRPSVAKYLGVEGSVGLTTVLIGRASVEDVVQSWGNGNLSVIAAGQVPPNPSELLGSARMSELIEHLSHTYDVVLIDAAPLLPVTDAAVLARLVGGAVLVVGANTIHRHEVEGALESLEAVNTKVHGIVVNRAPQISSGYHGGYSYYEYSSTPNGDLAAKKRFSRITGRGKRGAKAATPATAPANSSFPALAPQDLPATTAPLKRVSGGKGSGRHSHGA